MSNVARFEATGKQLDLIRRTVAADCNQSEFDLFIEVSRRVGLDPFRKQIYAIVYSKDKPDKRKMSIITGIDGFRAVAERSGKYRPDENEPQIFYDESLKDPATNPLGIDRAVVTGHKFGPDGQWHPLKGVAYWSEFAPLKEIWRDNKPTGEFRLPPDSNWRKMPRVMIAKCAEAQMVRKGWPEELGGIYAPEEMDRASTDATASELAEQAATEKRLELTKSKDTLLCLFNPGDKLEAVPVGIFADMILGRVTVARSKAEVTSFLETNQKPMQEFWARHPSDALGMKKEIEKIVADLPDVAT
jgi:phage recombination protein Bet